MISVVEAWKCLGIARGRDERAIKRAYAEKLKAIDPDRDIQAFTRLREALEVARMDARRRTAAEKAPAPPQTEASDIGGKTAGDEPVTELPVRKSPAEPAQPDEVVPEPNPVDLQAAILQRNLFPPEGVEPDVEAMIGAAHALLEDPRLEQVDFATGAEEWLATMAAHSIPRSDPVILILAGRFRWERELYLAKPRPLFLAVARRANDLRCVVALQDPGHKWHEAWVELGRPEPVRHPLGDEIRLRQPVSELMASLNYNNPGVLAACNRDVVDAWRGAIRKGVDKELVRAPGISWYGWFVILWTLLTAARLVVGAVGQ